jgi:hypothetical protein
MKHGYSHNSTQGNSPKKYYKEGKDASSKGGKSYKTSLKLTPKNKVGC